MLIEIELFLGMDRHVRLEIVLHFLELLACNNAKDFWKLSIIMASSKESLTSAKSSSLSHFFFLSVFIEAIVKSSIYIHKDKTGESPDVERLK